VDRTPTVILTAHAEAQLDRLGAPARAAVDWLETMDLDEIRWMAESLPPQHGREMWLLWADGVRVLFDMEDSDVTVHGIGLRPTRHSRRRRSETG